MRLPVLSNLNQIFTVWSQMGQQYEKDFEALKPKSGTVTLTANDTTTALAHLALRPTTKILFAAKTANGAAALPGLWYDTPTQGAVTLRHASSPALDQVLHYTILGV
jgi:hypothetical protein